jgi:hypothetical protein
VPSLRLSGLVYWLGVVGILGIKRDSLGAALPLTLVLSVTSIGFAIFLIDLTRLRLRTRVQQAEYREWRRARENAVYQIPKVASMKTPEFKWLTAAEAADYVKFNRRSFLRRVRKRRNQRLRALWDEAASLAISEV